MNRLLRAVGWTVVGLLLVLVVGFLLIRRPDLPYAGLQAKYGSPADRYMDLPAPGYAAPVHLRYRDQGLQEGPTLVMIHGFGASLADWEDWEKRLGDRYHIVSLDLPGHGLTLAPKGYHTNADGMADLVNEATARMALKRFVVIGNSMGGGVAWNLALRHPGRLDGLVLVDSVGPPPQGAQNKKPGGGPIVFALLRYPIMRGMLSQIDLSPLIGQGLRSAMVDPKLVTPALIARYGDFARAPGHRSVLLALQDGPRRDPMTLEARLATIKTPTLVMHGQDDRLIPYASGEDIARIIPGARFIGYPGVGHVPMEQIPDQSARDLDQWVKDKVTAPTR